jgi:nucleoside-diphosphate-sugar epimerase
MKILITGSSGHLGEALVRTLIDQGRTLGTDIISIDCKEGPYTSHIGTITDRGFVQECMVGVTHVLHAATLHKPHVATHSRQDFVDTNISGTLTLLEAATAHKVQSFIFTSTTSTFGDAMRPTADGPAIWVTEDLVPDPKNIYGITKLAAENLCLLAYKKDRLPCLVLRTSRFFPEDDDNKDNRDTFSNDNMKLNEFLNRRADIEDMVSAHLVAMEKACDIGFGTYIISATSPFTEENLTSLVTDAPSVIKKYVDCQQTYDALGWKLPPTLDRVYDNSRARKELGWEPQHSFHSTLQRVAAGGSVASDLARKIGKKGYHDQVFKNEPYPVD